MINKVTCNNHHLFFEPLKNGHFKAVDTWCGHKINQKIWYCSDKCKDKGIEGSPKGYISSDDEPIMND